MLFKVRHDLGTITESIEIIWIELQGRSKNMPFLTGVVYQASSNETEKLVLLEKQIALIHHVISTIPDRNIHHDVLNTKRITDNDTPYVIFNIKKEKYEPRYKFICNEKSLVMENYVTDFQQLPLNSVY